MPPIKKTVAASAAALSLSLPTTAVTGAGQADIYVACAGEALGPFCLALATAVQTAAPDQTVAVVEPADVAAARMLGITFVAARQTAQVLAGHLDWTDAAGSAGAGPVIDLTVIDGPMRPELLADYAAQLVGLSDLPL